MNLERVGYDFRLGAAAVAERGYAEMEAEDASKIAGVLKAAASGDFLDIHISTAEKVACKLQTAADKILDGGHVKAAAEAAQTFTLAYEGGVGYVIQRDLVHIVLADEAEHLL